MKRKMIVTGTNMNVVRDYITHSQMHFKTISTTTSWQDVENHFDVFKPDAYLIFPDKAEDIAVSQINKLKREACYNGCPVFICAPEHVCGNIRINYTFHVDLMIRRPVSADNLSLRIQKYFDDNEKKKSESEEKNAAATAQRTMTQTDPLAVPGINSKKHILIVDDDRTVLKMLKAALEKNYEVTTMVNGVLVQKFLSTKTVDLILLDYEMPVKTGAEVMNEIKSDSKFANIPICFLTGVTEREKIVEILKLHPNAYMQKPVNIDALTATVSNLIDEGA